MNNNMIKLTCVDGTNFITSKDYATGKMTELIDEAIKQNPERNVSYKVFKSGEMSLEELPEQVQAQVKSVLRAYPRCTVTYEYGKFSVGAGYCIKSNYNFDHYVAGTYLDSDVYTEEERRQNYFEEFGYAPCF